MPNYQERGQEGKENRNALRLSFPRGQTVAKDFENLSAEKRGDFRNILPHFSKPPTGVPRDHLRLPVPPGAGVQGLAISPCKQPSLIPGARLELRRKSGHETLGKMDLMDPMDLMDMPQ